MSCFERIGRSVYPAILIIGFSLAGSSSPPAQRLPASAKAPQVGDTVPDFTLPDAEGNPVTLSDLLVRPVGNTNQEPWTLLVFYRGYW